MGRLGEAFNHSGLSRFLNRPAGRVFRLLAGTAFLVIGYAFRAGTPGILAMGWGIFPISAGALDICYISAALGGPLSGATIRTRYAPQ